MWLVLYCALGIGCSTAIADATSAEFDRLSAVFRRESWDEIQRSLVRGVPARNEGDLWTTPPKPTWGESK